MGDEGRGMVLEVDMEYPEELHDIHNGYPLAPERKEIKKEMLSDYAREIAEKYDIKKLINTRDNLKRKAIITNLNYINTQHSHERKS